MIGRTLRHYRVVERIGAGGMGEVYRATDTRLGREVALKILPPEFSADSDRQARFLREAQLLATLNHPNIAILFGLEDFDGTHALVMELLQGDTLRERISSGRMPLRKAVEIGQQIAAGLSAAHEKGIVHRDLKPENIFVLRDGRAKILDFGLARLREGAANESNQETRADVTQPGRVLGTVGYMAPEQVRGQEADHRADIFSFGVILYEMLAGRRAFHRDTSAETMTAILREDPPELDSVASDVPLGLRRIVRRCLEKSAAERFQSARDLQFALEALSDSQHDSRSASVMVAEQLPSVAVLPFTDMSATKDQEYFCDGMAEEIINALSRVAGLRVAARTSTFHFKGRAGDLKQVAQALDVSHVLEGSVRTAGNRLRVTAQLVKASDGSAAWSDRYDGDMEDVFAIQDKIASSIVEALRVKLLGATLAAQPRTTQNLEAYRTYLKARYLRFSHNDFPSTIAACEQAVKLDPNYAFAYALLSDAATGMAIYSQMKPEAAREKASLAVQNALRLAPDLPEAHASDGYMKYFLRWDFAGAEKALLRALELNPENLDANVYYGVVLSSLRREKESMARIEKALRIDPLSPYVHGMRTMCLLFFGHYPEAVAAARQGMEIQLVSFLTGRMLAFALSAMGKHDEALEEMERVTASHKNIFYLRSELAWLYAKAGRTERAEQLLQGLKEEAATRYVSPIWLCNVAYALGRVDEAVALYEQAFAERCPVLVLRDYPTLADARQEPRICKMFERVGFPN
ncbi:MAG TPA: protein kinase [Candidatus Nitrosotenuis sp.]|nr:protein kinase [Candidatus Nitrosotenuis sp.]